MPEDFLEKFGNVAIKFEKCLQQTKQEEDNAPEVCVLKILLVLNVGSRQVFFFYVF